MLQVLAPCLLTLEGTLLGAQAFPWVGARTIAGAAGSGLVLWASHRYSWGLTGTPCGLFDLPTLPSSSCWCLSRLRCQVSRRTQAALPLVSLSTACCVQACGWASCPW